MNFKKFEFFQEILIVTKTNNINNNNNVKITTYIYSIITLSNHLCTKIVLGNRFLKCFKHL